MSPHRSHLWIVVMCCTCCMQGVDPVSPLTDTLLTTGLGEEDKMVSKRHSDGKNLDDDNDNKIRDNRMVDFSVESRKIREVQIRDITLDKLLVQFPNIYRPKNDSGGGRGGRVGGVSGGVSGGGRGGRVGGVSGGAEARASHYSLELIRLTYLPLVYTCGIRRRVPLSVQHIHVGSRIDFDVTSDVNPATTCLGANGCIFDRLVSFPFDHPQSPVRWQSQSRASYNPLSVFPSQSAVVDVKHCASREGWRRSQGYIPCVAAVIDPWFWMSHRHETQWRDAVNCRTILNKNNVIDQNHFCCICAPDSGDGASICRDFDVGAEVRHFSTSAACTRGSRSLGPRGTFGVCPYKCACGRAEEMEKKCRLELNRRDLERGKDEVRRKEEKEWAVEEDHVAFEAEAIRSEAVKNGFGTSICSVNLLLLIRLF